MRLCAFEGLKAGVRVPVRLVDPLHMATIHQSSHTTAPKALACFFFVLRAANECATCFYRHQTLPDAGA